MNIAQSNRRGSNTVLFPVLFPRYRNIIQCLPSFWVPTYTGELNDRDSANQIQRKRLTGGIDSWNYPSFEGTFSRSITK